jgi:hypothetical protein
LEQLVAGSFFNTAGEPTGVGAPYTLAPFGSTHVFGTTPAIAGFIADTSAAAPATAGLVNATGGIILVPTSATASATVTPDSLLFVDSAGSAGNAKLRTLVR